MKEGYSKRLNTLIHGSPENKKSSLEKREITLEIYKKIFKNGLQIQGPSEIRIADIQLTSAIDELKIFRLTKHLEEYNDSNCNASSSSGSQSTERTVYITDHLPGIFFLQKQQLIKDFKAARKADLKTMWKVEDGSYNLYVDGVKVNPNAK